MSKRIFPILIIFVSFSVASLYGQKKKKELPVLSAEEKKMVKKDASTMFTTTDYRGALSAYLDLYNADSQNVEYNYRLGYCYLVTTVNKKAALKHLEFAIQSKKDLKNEWFYYLGLAYMYNDKWDEAIKVFEEYKSLTHSKPIKDFPLPDRLIENCNNGKELSSHPVNCKFTNLGKNINTAYEEYNPVISGDGSSLFFTSRRKGNAGGFIEDLGIYTADIYFSLWKDTLWTKSKNLGVSVNTGWDEESVGISPNGDQLVLYFDNEQAYGDIGISLLKGKMWQKPIMLPLPINTKEEEYSACFSSDFLTIYFSSNRKEGIGGKDLWMSQKTDGIWGKPENLGKGINSVFDERNPTLSLDGKRLYFSSKGWNSMGDFDIFCCYRDEATGKWSKPVNIGYPINDADDNSGISFTGDNRFAYVSACRREGFGDRDIYKIEFLDTLNHPFAHVISGNVSGGGGKVAIRKVTLNNLKTEAKQEFATQAQSSQFVMVVQPGEYSFKVEAKNYQAYTDSIVVNDDFPPARIIKNVIMNSSK